MSNEKRITPDSKRAWMVLLSVVFSTFASGGLQMSFGTILGALVREFGDSKSKTAWVGTLVTFFSCVLSPLAIFLAQRHGVRVTQLVGGIIMTIGVIASSMIDTINYMFFTYGVLLGISGALVYSPAVATIPELFVKHVSLATGIGSAGNTLGLIFFSFTLPILLDEFGWRPTLWFLAGIGPLVSILGFTLPKTAVTLDSGIEEKPGQGAQDKLPWWKHLKKRAYILLSISALLYTMVDFVPLYLVPLCAAESGMSLDQTKWFSIVFGFGSLIGRLFSGPLAKPLLRHNRCKYLNLACLFMYSISSFLVSLSIRFEWLISYMVFIGVLNGTLGSLFYLVILEVVGLEGYPVACGVNLAICGLSWTIGPPMAGLLYESVNNVKYLLLTVAATMFLAAVVMAIIPCISSRRSYTLHQSDYDYWRVYCRHPNISPRPTRQNKAFTVQEAIVGSQVNLGYEADVVGKVKSLSGSVSTTELLMSMERQCA